MEDWKTIDTAPKDRTEILLAKFSSDGPSVVENGAWLPDYWEEGDTMPTVWPVWFTPTHWSPMAPNPLSGR